MPIFGVRAGKRAAGSRFVAPVEGSECVQRPVAVGESDNVRNIGGLEACGRHNLARCQQPVAWLALPKHLSRGGIKISRRALQEWLATQAGR